MKPRSSGSFQLGRHCKRGGHRLCHKCSKEELVYYRLEPGTPLRPEQIERLKKLDEMPDNQIDLFDIREWTEEMWKNARRGGLYRPIKQPVSVRVDADVPAWLKKAGPGCQSRINAYLRERMLAEFTAQGGGKTVTGSVAVQASDTARRAVQSSKVRLVAAGWLLGGPALEGEQGLLACESPPVAGEFAVRTYDSVAGDYDRGRVLAAGGADGADRVW